MFLQKWTKSRDNLRRGGHVPAHVQHGRLLETGREFQKIHLRPRGSGGAKWVRVAPTGPPEHDECGDWIGATNLELLQLSDVARTANESSAAESPAVAAETASASTVSKAAASDANFLPDHHDEDDNDDDEDDHDDDEDDDDDAKASAVLQSREQRQQQKQVEHVHVLSTDEHGDDTAAAHNFCACVAEQVLQAEEKQQPEPEHHPEASVNGLRVQHQLQIWSKDHRIEGCVWYSAI